MEYISSKNNPKIKKIRSLSVKKYRESFGLFVLEGEKVVREAISLQKGIDTICVRESETQRFDSLIENFKMQTLVLSDEVFDSISSTQTPQDILAVVKVSKQNLFDKQLSKVVVLDRLQDPGNVGTIIRSGIASGFEDFVLIETADPYSDKVVRSSSGTILHANIFQVTTSEFIEFVKRTNLDLVVAEANKISVYDNKLKLPKTFGLVIGNEGSGISDEIHSLPHISVSIPMDKRVESLNAGVSASILMFLLSKND